MKNKILLFIVLFFPILSIAQENKEFVPSGKFFATIFANFHKGITGSAADLAAFELTRGYIGYEYNLSPEFFAKINLDIGSPEDLSIQSKIRRYAYFKNAFLQYSHKKLQVEFGLITLRQFKLQEDIWERRYMKKTVADEYRLGASADLGMNIHYGFSKMVDVDLTMMNGEGYSSLQMDDVFKYSIGSTLRWPGNFTSRLVYDIMTKEVSETTLLFFSSYQWKAKWNLAGEFVYRRNNAFVSENNITAISIYGKYNLLSKLQLFGRYDIVNSNILGGEIIPWNLAKDGTAVTAGIQYQPIKNIKMALDYQDWVPKAANIEGGGFIFLDLEVKM